MKLAVCRRCLPSSTLLSFAAALISCVSDPTSYTGTSQRQYLVSSPRQGDSQSSQSNVLIDTHRGQVYVPDPVAPGVRGSLRVGDDDDMAVGVNPGCITNWRRSGGVYLPGSGQRCPMGFGADWFGVDVDAQGVVQSGTLSISEAALVMEVHYFLEGSTPDGPLEGSVVERVNGTMPSAPIGGLGGAVGSTGYGACDRLLAQLGSNQGTCPSTPPDTQRYVGVNLCVRDESIASAIVLCWGARCTGDSSQRMNYVSEARRVLTTARELCVAGGGAGGTCMSGEICPCPDLCGP